MLLPIRFNFWAYLIRHLNHIGINATSSSLIEVMAGAPTYHSASTWRSSPASLVSKNLTGFWEGS